MASPPGRDGGNDRAPGRQERYTVDGCRRRAEDGRPSRRTRRAAQAAPHRLVEIFSRWGRPPRIVAPGDATEAGGTVRGGARTGRPAESAERGTLPGSRERLREAARGRRRPGRPPRSPSSSGAGPIARDGQALKRGARRRWPPCSISDAHIAQILLTKHMVGLALACWVVPGPGVDKTMETPVGVERGTWRRRTPPPHAGYQSHQEGVDGTPPSIW